MALLRTSIGTELDYNWTLIHELDVLGTPVLLMTAVDETGTDVHDQSPYSHDFTASESVATWFGRDGRALNYYSISTDEYMNLLDDAHFSFTTGAADTAFSVLALVYGLGAPFTGTLASKWDETAGVEAREWKVDFTAGVLGCQLYDETANDTFSSVVDVAVAHSGWHFVGWTYSGSGAVTGLTPYVDGIEVAHTDTAAVGGYANMRDTTSDISIGCYEDAAGAKTNFINSRITWLAITPVELTAGQVWSLYRRMQYIANL